MPIDHDDDSLPCEPAPPVDPNELSRALLAQIDARLRDSVGISQRSTDYYVIRSQATRVLSVLASTTLGQDHDVVWGPRPFAQCIAYVNSTMVTRIAEKGEPDLDPKEAP